jgi:hypothetical protein
VSRECRTYSGRLSRKVKIKYAASKHAASTASIEATAIPEEELPHRIDKLAASGLVLVLLDACRSGCSVALQSLIVSDICTKEQPRGDPA